MDRRGPAPDVITTTASRSNETCWRRTWPPPGSPQSSEGEGQTRKTPWSVPQRADASTRPKPPQSSRAASKAVAAFPVDRRFPIPIRPASQRDRMRPRRQLQLRRTIPHKFVIHKQFPANRARCNLHRVHSNRRCATGSTASPLATSREADLALISADAKQQQSANAQGGGRATPRFPAPQG
jgi:hypothetical protein